MDAAFPSFVFVFPLILCFVCTLYHSLSMFPVKPRGMWFFFFNNFIWNRWWHCQCFLVWCTVQIYPWTPVDEIVETVFARECHRKHSKCFKSILKKYLELISQWIQRETNGRRTVQFVVGFWAFSISQWLGAHYACFGQDGETSLGHLFWKRSTEGPQWGHSQ